jgi:RNA polymerase sigma factor (sigma-70 family)
MSAFRPLADLVVVEREPESSFRVLYEAEAEQVFRTVLLLCRDEELARDATQEAFARLLERWHRLQGEPWLGGWVMTSALNIARRSLRRPRSIEAGASQQTGIEDVELWDVVRELPAKQRAAVVLRYRIGLDTVLIAEAMGLREGTVRTHLARARHTLKERLSAEEVDDGLR